MPDAKSPSAISDDALADIVAAGAPPAVIEFWSFRCEQSRHVAPRISRIAASVGDNVAVYKANADECALLTSHFRIPLIPAVVVLDGGAEIGRFVEDWSDDDVLALVQGR
jgi:thioredoxin-like negative regulator of GroEL